MSLPKTVIASFVLAVALAPAASADLSRHDPNDVPMRLDLRRISSTTYPTDDGWIGMSIRLYRGVPWNQDPRIVVFYDAFGSPRADFAVRFAFYEPGMVGCRLFRLGNGRLVYFGEVDEDWREYYCEFPRRPGMRSHSGIRWRVSAVTPGVGRDFAPDAGWYPHV